jgi:hypothetical protein
MTTIKDFKEELVENVRNKMSKKAQEDIIIKIEKNDIKTGLGKKRLHKSIINKMKEEFKSSGLKIKDDCDSAICVIIPKEKLNSNVKSYKEIMSK